MKNKTKKLIENQKLKEEALVRAKEEARVYNKVVRFYAIPDNLSEARKMSLTQLENTRNIAQLQKKYIKDNPDTHMRNLLKYVNDFLDFYQLPQLPKWERLGADNFYLGNKIGSSTITKPYGEVNKQ